MTPQEAAKLLVANLKHPKIAHPKSFARYVTVGCLYFFGERRSAAETWNLLSDKSSLQIGERLRISVASGDLLYLHGGWYVTHVGLLRLARRSRCCGIRVHPVRQFCDPTAGRWVSRATVYRSRRCKGFVGYGDADPSNVSPVVHG